MQVWRFPLTATGYPDEDLALLPSPSPFGGVKWRIGSRSYIQPGWRQPLLRTGAKSMANSTAALEALSSDAQGVT